MTEYEGFFKDDPWIELTKPSYPEGRQLYMNDARFWVSTDEQMRIQFFVHEMALLEVKSLENLAGIEISINAFNNRSSRLICTLLSDNKSDKEKFSIVAKDVAFHCAKFHGLQLFVEVQKRIKSWAYFLKPTHKGLSNSEFIGFLGELYAVTELLMKNHGASDVVRFWIGPDYKKQDITMNSMAIEVKTSTSGDPLTIKISSKEQLEQVTEFLYLMHIILNPSNDEQGFSLKSLYETSMSNLSCDLSAETLFMNKTSKFYGRASESQLNEKFLIQSLSLFDVRDDFPSITDKDIKPGISDVKYEISSHAIKKFEVTDRIEAIVKNG